eukprot:c1331_g1_i1.p1 GENE.c1331_g1_i1~~c1331_g1_i1.p1  ORF type:complete len:425 (+),score=34.25 c1331_g1_i1:158-1432(+)
MAVHSPNTRAEILAAAARYGTISPQLQFAVEPWYPVFAATLFHDPDFYFLNSCGDVRRRPSSSTVFRLNAESDVLQELTKEPMDGICCMCLGPMLRLPIDPKEPDQNASERSLLLAFRNRLAAFGTVSHRILWLGAVSSSSLGHHDGPSSVARFAGITCIVATRGGLGVVTERENHAVRVIALDSPELTVATLAGGTRGTYDGIGTAAQFVGPVAVALALDERTAFVSDVKQMGHKILVSLIRVVCLSTGAVRTLAGGSGGYADGLGMAAKFAGVTSLLVAPCGTLFCTDQYNHRIRAISPEGQVSTFPGTAAVFSEPVHIALGPDSSLMLIERRPGFRVIAGAYSVARYHPIRHREAPPRLRALFLTLIVLWRGQSPRLLALESSRGLRGLLLLPMTALLQCVQAAVWLEVLSAAHADFLTAT